MAAMQPSIPEEIKIFIINALAAFDSPSQVCAAVKEEFGAELSRQAVQAHDPTKTAGKNLAAKWRTLFTEARKAFVEDATTIPIANRSTRLRALQRMADKAEKAGNMALAISIHKQAAEEMGDAFTNRRNLDLSSRDGSMSPRGLGDLYGDDDSEKPE